ncbi:MAG: DUF501 domain-containing protein [Deltaproteobacteria bacterium]
MNGASALVSGADAAVVAGQLGRPPHAMSAVAARCPFGFPAVVEDLPYDGLGRPFPTLYYCTCPTLVAAVGRLESGGGVSRWTARLAADPALARSAADAAADAAVRRADLVRAHGLTMVDGGSSLSTGVGGVGDLLAVKCLHAHVAHALARPGYVLGEAILAEIARPWCDDRRCAAFAPDGAAGVDGAGVEPSSAHGAKPPA